MPLLALGQPVKKHGVGCHRAECHVAVSWNCAEIPITLTNPVMHISDRRSSDNFGKGLTFSWTAARRFQLAHDEDERNENGASILSKRINFYGIVKCRVFDFTKSAGHASSIGYRN